MKRASISTKMIVLLIFTSVMTLVINVMMFLNINQVLVQIEQVYATNVQLNEMTEELDKVHSEMLEYLKTRDSNVLQEYYISQQNLSEQLVMVQEETMDRQTSVLKNNIYYLGKNYLKISEEAVKAKRGRDVNTYGERYEDAGKMKEYLNGYISSLNNIQFQGNSNNYLLLQNSLYYMEVVGTIMFFVVVLCDTIMVVMMTRRLTKPLKILSGRAKEVTAGDLSVDIPVFRTGDEVESLSKAFDKMMGSIREYVEAQRVSMEKENEMRENELKTQTLLKDAQLKYLQSQINPHFLFNTLNAGMQLAMIEDADKTALFIENMAEFFRYNLSRINEDATLADEIRLVDHYIYILNVRFAGDIHYKKEIEPGLENVLVPSMILQPLVENAVQYGIRGVEWEGWVTLRIWQEAGTVYIEVADNGRGMSRELIERVLRGENVKNKKNSKSNGIGIYNVLERLQMYYTTEDVLEIESDGEGEGTRFTLKIPKEVRP
ncbi:signal transduction histidine kinase LytS [Roseburia sp. CAG:309]|nr:signal transduction histidine kinase LytS [Roseburia sp. CAG:309]